MADLVLGPVLRHVGATDAVVWVQADRPCEVSVLGAATRTFCVEGCHFALVVVEGLEPGAATPYDVRLDGEPAWPRPGDALPAPVIRTLRPAGDVRLVFGSCRASAPHEPPFTQAGTGPERAYGIDALRALALRMTRRPPEDWPDALLMLGDQIYADDLSPDLREAIGGDQLGGFADHVRAYGEAWGEPVIRWLLSVLPSSMVFDDHEIHAEWKISHAWMERMHAEPWYDERVTAGLAAYWVFQHLGNASPAELAGDPLLRAVRAAPDGAPVLREHARSADRQPGHSRWSFRRDLGRARLVVVDSRAGRELEPGRRQMIDAGEWAWLEEQLTGDVDHLLVASSVPFFLVHGLHDLEAWNEAVCDGAWGARAAGVGERIRQAAVLDHWAAFQASFARLAGVLEAVATGARGRPPASIVLLSGDVHHCYLAEIGFRRPPGPRAPVWQAVCSPYRKALSPRERAAMRLGASPVGRALGRLLARSARLPPPPLGWRLVERPCYDNQVATLALAPGRAHLRVETTAGSAWRDPRLREVFARDLT